MLAVPSMAQFASGGFELDRSNLYYGARMGLTLSNVSGDEMNGLDFSGVKAGLTLGGVVGLRVSNTSPVFLESGLYYTQRGGKDGDAKMNLKYLEVPVVIKYGIKVSDDIAVLPFIGPYFSYSMFGGRVTGEAELVNAGIAKVTQELDESSFNDGYANRTDMGMKFGCGMEYDMLYLEAGYQVGIANIADGKSKTNHGNAFVVNFGVNF